MALVAGPRPHTPTAALSLSHTPTPSPACLLEASSSSASCVPGVRAPGKGLSPAGGSATLQGVKPNEDFSLGFPGGSVGKNPPVTQETRVQSLGQEDPLEKEMATSSCILAWEIPWTEEPGGLESLGSQRVRHYLAIGHACTLALLG